MLEPGQEQRVSPERPEPRAETGLELGFAVKPVVEGPGHGLALAASMAFRAAMT